MGIVSGISLILESCSIDGDTSCFFFRSFVNFGVLDVLGFLFCS